MRKLTLIAVALMAVGTFALAGELQIAEGKVAAISGNTVTVEGDSGEVWDFEATSGSKVIAEGAAHKKRNLAAVGMKTTVGHLVREGNYVTVKYFEEDGTLFIKKLRVH